MMRRIGLAALIMLLAAPCGATSLARLNTTERDARLSQDALTVARYRDGMQRLIQYAGTRAELFPVEKNGAPHILSATAREEVRTLWQALLDYQLALDSLRRYHLDFAKLRAAHQLRRVRCTI